MKGQDNHRRWLVLWLLFAVNTMNFFDRQVLFAVVEPIRREWNLSDTKIGLLSTSFTLLYALVGIPLGRVADLWQRRFVLSASLALWSGLTYISGFCRDFSSLFLARLGVGVGEAGCAPSASSLIGDLFPPQLRSRAMAIFMLGLPCGGALSFAVSGSVAQHYGWRNAFFIAGIPGLVLAAAALFLREPARGGVENYSIGAERRPGSPYRLVFGPATMKWIVASGVIHNFIMYALTSFLPAFLMRHHRTSLQAAGWITGLLIGGAGAAGSLAGGWLGDWMAEKRANGRLLVSSISALLGVPAAAFAFSRPAGDLSGFIVSLLFFALVAYIYYPTVYSSIQDIIEPGLRGTAMAVYFFAMYLLGGSLGPLATGWLSDRLALRSGNGAWSEAAKVAGLQQALYIIPVLGLLLAGFLFAGSSTVARDRERLQHWMKETSGE